ncbi:4115_t:CDS:2, partial [Gigaspora margarita]
SYVSQPFCNSNQALTLIHETRSIFISSITIVVDETVSKNAAVQKRSLSIKKENAEKLIELQKSMKSEKKEYIDEHYCLASVKGIKQFAAMFLRDSVIISQDDKAKVPLEIPTVGKRTHQKLIPSVYLAIDSLDSNDTLRKGQLAIFVCSQYNVGTNQLIWVLLVDSGPDENPRYLKNILRYSKLFQFFDLDYCIVRTHAPGQSAYNLVEWAMYTLSEKFAGITLPIDTFGSHLNSQSKVINQELAKKNFRRAGETLCTL